MACLSPRLVLIILALAALTNAVAPAAFAQNAAPGQKVPTPAVANQGDDQGDPALPSRGGKPGRVSKEPLMRSENIDVIRATFGSRFEQNPCDVTAAVRKACQDRISCSVPVDDRLCTSPGQGLPPLIPTLNVQYRCATTTKFRIKAAEKPFLLRIDCALGVR